MARKPSPSFTRAGPRRASQAALGAKPRRGRQSGKPMPNDAAARTARPSSRQKTGLGRGAKTAPAPGRGQPRGRQREAETAMAEQMQLLLEGLRGLQGPIEALNAKLDPFLGQVTTERDPERAPAPEASRNEESAAMLNQSENGAPDGTERAEPVPSD